MTQNRHGEKPGKHTPIKKVAGSFDTTTATTNNATQIIALYAQINGFIVRRAVWLAAVFHGSAV